MIAEGGTGCLWRREASVARTAGWVMLEEEGDIRGGRPRRWCRASTMATGVGGRRVQEKN